MLLTLSLLEKKLTVIICDISYSLPNEMKVLFTVKQFQVLLLLDRVIFLIDMHWLKFIKVTKLHMLECISSPCNVSDAPKSDVQRFVFVF